MEGNDNFAKTTYIGGDYIEIIKGKKTEYVLKKETHVNKQYNETAKKGKKHVEAESPPKKQSPTRVKEIELITPLDDGSANDRNGGTQPGFVFGKTYEFKVKSFTNGNPISNQLIKWTHKYHNLSNNQWTNVPLNTRGDTLKLTLNDPEMCGRFVYIRAYIDDEDNEGELKKWHHNRFRWFDSKVIENEIKERTDNKKPWLVNQSGTSLCGMACIFYLFAKEQPDAYKKFAKTLFRKGEATFNKYTVKPSEELFIKEIEKIKEKPISVKGTSGMPLIDFVTMAGTRNADNSSYKGGDEEFQAINWPPLMTKLSENLLSYGEVVSHGIYNPIKKSENYPVKSIFKIIEDINEQIKNGYKIMLMIDSDLISDDPDFYFPKKLSIEEIKKSIQSPFQFDYHWVVLETSIKESPWLNSKGNTEYKLDFKVFTWGGKTEYLKEQITLSHFINNFYGYIKVK